MVNDAKELDQVINNFVLHVDNREQLEGTRKWARQSIALRNEAYNNATYARLLLKLGDYQQALRQANKAVQLSIQAGEEDSEKYEQIIAEIQQKLRE